MIICLGNKQICEVFEQSTNRNYAKNRAREVILRHFTHPIQEHANRKMVELLRLNGADVSHRLNDGSMPLHVAIAMGKRVIKY